MSEFERTYLEAALCRSGGNIAAAARASGKPRRAFFELMRKRGVLADQSSAEGAGPSAKQALAAEAKPIGHAVTTR